MSRIQPQFPADPALWASAPAPSRQRVVRYGSALGVATLAAMWVPPLVAVAVVVGGLALAYALGVLGHGALRRLEARVVEAAPSQVDALRRELSQSAFVKRWAPRAFVELQRARLALTAGQGRAARKHLEAASSCGLKSSPAIEQAQRLAAAMDGEWSTISAAQGEPASVEDALVRAAALAALGRERGPVAELLDQSKSLADEPLWVVTDALHRLGGGALDEAEAALMRLEAEEVDVATKELMKRLRKQLRRKGRAKSKRKVGETSSAESPSTPEPTAAATPATEARGPQGRQGEAKPRRPSRSARKAAKQAAREQRKAEKKERRKRSAKAKQDARSKASGSNRKAPPKDPRHASRASDTPAGVGAKPKPSTVRETPATVATAPVVPPAAAPRAAVVPPAVSPPSASPPNVSPPAVAPPPAVAAPPAVAPPALAAPRPGSNAPAPIPAAPSKAKSGRSESSDGWGDLFGSDGPDGKSSK